MPGILDALSSLDLGRLSGHLEVANGTVSVSGSLDLTTLDPRDLLGELGDLLRSLEDLPSGPGGVAAFFQGAVGELEGILTLPELGTVGEVAAQLQGAARVLERVVEHLGDGEGLVDRILDDLGGLEGLLGEITARFVDTFPVEIPEELRLPVEAIQTLAAGAPSSPEALARLLAQFLAGVDLPALAAPGLAIQGMVAEVRACGGDFGPIEAEIGRLTAEVRGVITLLGAPAPDVAAAVAALTRIRGGLDLLIGATLPGAFARLSTDLTALAPADVARRLGAALEPLLARIPPVGEDLAETLLTPMREFVARVEDLTPELLRSLFAELEESLRHTVETSDLAALPGAVDDLLGALFGLVDRVPLRRLRDELLGMLNDLEGRIRGLSGFGPAWLLGERLQGLQDAIDGVDLSAIQDRVQELVDAVNGAADAFPIEEIRQELDSLIGAVGGAIESFTPALENLAEQIGQLAEQVGAIDFEVAGQASIDLMGDIREAVREAVGSGDVPEPLQAAIGLAAQGLREIDLAAQVSAPAEAVLVEIDPSAILAPLEPAFAELRRVLEMVTPGAIIQRLDEPFSQLVGALSQIRPDLLVGSLSGEFGRLLDLVGNLDPRRLVAPLEAEFQRLLAAVHAAADPAPLFAPLRDAYALLQGLLDRLDFLQLFGAILGRVSGLPSVVGSSVQQAFAARAGTAGAALPVVGDAPFRLGDIIRPLALLLAQVRGAVTGLAGDLIGGGLGLLAAPVAELRRLTDPERGPLAEVARALGERRAQLDLLAGSGPAAELRAALRDLSAAAAGLTLEGSARAELDGGVASVQIEGRADVTAGVPGVNLDAQAGELLAALSPPDLAVALSRLHESLDRILPAALLSAEGTAAARLAALFDGVDPAPIAAELDAIGDRVQAKLQTLALDLAQGLFGIWNSIFGMLSPVLPQGLLAQLNTGLDRVKAQLAALDPAPLEQEVRELLDAVLSVLGAYSPAAVAAELGTVFDAALDKLRELDPATLLGDLDPLAGVIDGLEQLRPSVVLAPLVESTAGLEQALERLTSLELGGVLIEATADLRVQLERVVEGLEQELNGLLDDLSGGGIHVSASASVSA